MVEEQEELYQVNSMPYTDPTNSNNSGYYSGTINKHTSLPHGRGSFALDYQKLPLVGIWKDGIMIQQKQSNRLSNASKEEGVNAGDDVSVMTGVTQQVSNTSPPTSGTTNTNNKPSISVPVGKVNNSSLLLDDDDDNEGEDMINQFKKRSSTGSNISHNSSVPPRRSSRMSNPHNLSLIQEEEISRRNLLDGSYRSQRSQRNMLDSSNRSSSRGLENALDNSARSGRNNMLAMSVGHTAAEDYTGEHDFRHSTGSFGGGHYYGDGQDEQWNKRGSQGSNVPSYYEQPDQYIDPSAYNDDIDASHRSTVSTTSSGQRRVSFKNDNELCKSGKILSSNGKGLSPAQLIAQDSKSNTYLLDASGRSLAEIEALQQQNIAWGSSSSTGSTTPRDQLLDRSSSSRTPRDNDEVTPTPEQIEALNKKNRWKIIPVSFGSKKKKKQKENKMQTLHSESITERQRRKRKYCIIALLLCMVIGGAAGVIYFLFYTKNVQEEVISDPSFNATNTTTTSQQPQDTLNDDTQEKSETISKLPWDDDTPCANLIISILTDKFGNETSWELFYDNPYKNDGMDNNVLLATDKRKRLRKHKIESATTTSRYLSATSMNNNSSHSSNNDNDDNMTLILQSGPYKYLDTADPTYISNISNQYSSQICLPMGQYKFIIHDTNNNGICCMYGMGEYKGQFVNDGRVVFMGDGIFQNMDEQEFEVLRDDIVASMQLSTTTISDEGDDGNETTLILDNITLPRSPSFDPLSLNATNDTSFSLAPTPAGSNDTLSSRSDNATISVLISIPGNLTFTNLIYPPETQEENDLMIVVLEDTIQDVAIKALTETDEDDDDEAVRKVVIQEVKILGINGKPLSEDTADKIPDEQDSQEVEDDQVRYLQTAANVTQSDINSTLVMFNLILEESCEVCDEEDFLNTTTTYYEDTITPFMNDQVDNGSLTVVLQDRVKQNSVYQSLNDTTTYNDLFEGVEIVDGEFNVTVVQSDFDYTTSSSLEDSIILDEVNETDTLLSTNATSNVTGILNATDSSSSNTTVFNDTNIPPGTSNVTTTYYNSTDNSNSTTILNSTDIEPSTSTSNLTTFFNDTIDLLNTTDTNSTTPFSCPDTLNQSSIINSQSTLYYEVAVPSLNTSSDANNNGIFCARLEVIDIEDGWVGIGFSHGGKMEGSQAIIGVPNDGIVQKYTLSGYYPSVMSDERQTLQDTSISIDEDGKTVMKFAKQLVEEDEIPIIHDGENILLHAWGNSMLGYHTGKLSFVLDLSSNRTEVPSSAPSQSSAPTVYNPELSYSKSLLIEGSSNSSYGRDIDFSAGILAVGAPNAVNKDGEMNGAVYLYTLLDSFKSNDTATAEGENTTIMPPQPFNILYGVSPESSFGSSVALSSKHLVVGAWNEDNETGVVRIYDIIDTDTVVMSGEFFGISPGDRFGMSVSISSDGNVIGVSATNGLIDGVTDGGGRVTTYQYQGEEWVQNGLILEGGMDGDVSLDLSNDGTVMVIGATREERSGHSRSAGKAAVFAIKDDGTEWILRQDLFGDTKGSNDGTSVAISADGSVLVVGGPSYTALINEDPKKMAGRCKVYEWDVNTSKYELIHSILGQRKYEKIGVSAAVSDDGNVVACGGNKGRWGANHMGVSGDVRLWNGESLNSKILWPEGESRLIVDEALFGASITLSNDGLLFVGAPGWIGSNEDSPGSVHIYDHEW